MDFPNFITSNLIDIILGIILLICFIIGARRGLILSVFKTFSSIIAIIGSYILNPIISSAIRNTSLFTGIANSVSEKLIFGTSPDQAAIIADAASQTQSQQISFINGLDVSNPLKQMLLDNNNSVIYSMLGAESIADYAARFISNIILNIIVSIALFIIIFIAIKIIMHSLGFISRLPLLKQVNFLGGGIIGIVSGIIFIWLLFAVMTAFIAQPFFKNLNDNIYNSILGKYLYDNNLILKLIINSLFK